MRTRKMANFLTTDKKNPHILACSYVWRCGNVSKFGIKLKVIVVRNFLVGSPPCFPILKMRYVRKCV